MLIGKVPTYRYFLNSGIFSVSAAELEVETAAFHHAELLQNIEELEAVNKTFEQDVSNYNIEINKLTSA